MIIVYPKMVVYCPNKKREQDGNKCLSCSKYQANKIVNKRIVIECKED